MYQGFFNSQDKVTLAKHILDVIDPQMAPSRDATLLPPPPPDGGISAAMDDISLAKIKKIRHDPLRGIV